MISRRLSPYTICVVTIELPFGREGSSMRRLMTIIAKLIYQYGTIYSRKPSAHGSYEAPVPQRFHE